MQNQFNTPNFRGKNSLAKAQRNDNVIVQQLLAERTINKRLWNSWRNKTMKFLKESKESECVKGLKRLLEKPEIRHGSRTLG